MNRPEIGDRGDSPLIPHREKARLMGNGRPRNGGRSERTSTARYQFRPCPLLGRFEIRMGDAQLEAQEISSRSLNLLRTWRTGGIGINSLVRYFLARIQEPIGLEPGLFRIEAIVPPTHFE